MKISEFISELKNRDLVLYRIAVLMLLLTFVLIIPLLIDTRQILGINPWIKPMKFSLSIVIYATTIAWFLEYIKTSPRWSYWISRLTALSLMVDMLIILIQSARGVQSHFNKTSNFDALLFGVMGIMIGLSTLLITIYMLILIRKKTSGDGPFKWSIIMGILVFLAASWVGGVMIQYGSHTIGAQDGGPGITFFNWSLDHGDLRVAHFIGLHALQIIPISTFVFLKFFHSKTAAYLVLVIMVSAYTALFYFLYLQAMAGNPFLSLD